MIRKRKLHRLFLASLLCAALSLALGSPLEAQGPVQASDYSELITIDKVMPHVQALAVEIGPRLLGTETEARAAEYIAAHFRTYGYEAVIQTFGTIAPEECEEPNPTPLTSRNVIATRFGDGNPEEVIVVGAHMDSVAIGQGASDNASGVAVMLAAAEALAEVETTRTLVFVAFGANEGGCSTGSDAYIQALGDEIGRVVAMINLDGVGIGEQLNAYAGATAVWGAEDQAAPVSFEGGPVWLRDLAFELGATLRHSLGTTPAESWDGFIGDWGDHIGFVEHGIPIVYLEAWRWRGEGVADPWWGAETAAGDLSHTDLDLIEAINPATLEAAAELAAALAHALATGATALPAS